MLDFLILVLVRVFAQATVYAVAPALPFFVLRESRDVLEYIALDAASRLKFFENTSHFIYSFTWLLTSAVPQLPALDVTKVLILLVDIASAALWYNTTRLLSNSGLEKNKHASSPLFIAALHLLNPFSIMYNEGCNADSVRYFWVSLATFAAVNINVERGAGIKPYVIYQLAASGFLINGVFKMYAVLPALTMVAVHNRLQQSNEPSITWKELKQMFAVICPHIFLTLSIVILYYTARGESVVKRALELEYTGRGTGIDYSLYWYLHRVLPAAFEATNTFKSQMMIFVLPFPLLVLLRKRPMECLITTFVIAILQHPNLSLLGLWYIVCLCALHYPMMDKTIGFTKMMMVAIGAMCFSVTAYVTWVGRYIANPNYFFAPQLLIFATICILLEDYTKATFQLSNSTSQVHN
ncbi:membrane protein, putative [Babesia bigemina]|uniref:Membrane protein, putative n=1 Tax=Babesia bigemina TaxID=5866 RepID=A0A061DEH1_BABBI|nr:membrane protein, putative [Babesia bigemina]CDR97270.1 membrane protein, putative [Babesia bigemina]|eukprot:XP_012769456.1 membrane protein, putative [Babesia bigemina]